MPIRRPAHGCHGYSSSRNSVLWAFSSLVVQHDQAPRLDRIQATSTRGVRARIRRVAGCATPTGSAGHAGATANLKLTFHLDHSAGADQVRRRTICESQIDHFVMAITSAEAIWALPSSDKWLDCRCFERADCTGKWERKMMMRALFLRVAIGTCAAISLGASAANAQLVKPKYPGEIAAASNHIAQRNEDCRRQAREQHLHLVKRYRFMRDCKRL